MNDDYDDPDEPGGLWDPDAISAPPPRPRTVLRAVPQPDAVEPEASTFEPAAPADETLVRLDQFRPVAADDETLRAPLSRRWLYGAAAVAATAVLGAGTLVLTSRQNNGATPAVATFSGPDAEQAAVGRIVAPRPAKRGDSGAAKDRRAKVARRSSRPSRVGHTVQQRRLPATPAPTNQLASTTTQSTSRTTPGAHAAASSTVAPASSNDPEFGFER
jgi:hypothetical protein